MNQVHFLDARFGSSRGDKLAMPVRVAAMAIASLLLWALILAPFFA